MFLRGRKGGGGMSGIKLTRNGKRVHSIIFHILFPTFLSCPCRCFAVGQTATTQEFGSVGKIESGTCSGTKTIVVFNVTTRPTERDLRVAHCVCWKGDEAFLGSPFNNSHLHWKLSKGSSCVLAPAMDEEDESGDLWKCVWFSV